MTSPTPLWFSRLSIPTTDIQLDGYTGSLLDRIASIQNLHHAWFQALTQARERDVFEDVLAFKAFGNRLWAHLNVLREELLAGKYHHQPFRILPVPKKKGDPQNTRPMSWANPWDSVAMLAVLNVIGPAIDSTFHPHALGNRLVHGPKSDDQVFEDWRKQIQYRELKCSEFAEYGGVYHYVLTDISRFYECVRHDRLMTLLRTRIDDQAVLDLFQQYLEADWLLNTQPIRRQRSDGTQCGIPQGPALSAFLANLYLCDLDAWLENRSVQFVRYVDDLAILFDSKSDAEAGVEELSQYLLRECDLALSSDADKTRGPFPATDTRPIRDWIREARYELAKYSWRGHTLSENDKNDLRAALSEVAGAHLQDAEDLNQLVKYLGFYVATTERLDQPDLQHSVYALAQWVLNEQRPKHNATCIAIKALIKACHDFGDTAWSLVKGLLEARQDEYIRVILAQETRRLSEDTGLGAQPWTPLLKEFEKIAGSGLLVASSASLAALAIVGHTSPEGRDCLWRIALGDQPYLRPRAMAALANLDAISAAAAARVIPDDGEEANLLLLSTQQLKSRAIVEAIANRLESVRYAIHSLCALLSASLRAASERGMRVTATLSSWLGEEGIRNIHHHLAREFVNEVVNGMGTSADIEKAVQAAISAGLGTLAAQLDDLGKYAGVLYEGSSVLDSCTEEVKAHLKSEYVPKLPRIDGVMLQAPLFQTEVGIWLHAATDSNRNALYHEIVGAIALRAIGCEAAQLQAIYALLKQASQAIIGKVEIQARLGDTIFLSTYPLQGGWRRIADVINQSGPYENETVADILPRIAQVLQTVKRLFANKGFPSAFLPTPTLHTLVINHANDVRFANIAPTIIPQRTYIGLKGKQLRLQADAWETHALGLCLFEMTTGACAASTLSRLRTGEKLSDSHEARSKGAVFAGIVGKATIGEVRKGYDSAEFLLKDVGEWLELERRLARSSVGSPRADRMRRLLHIQLGVERREHLLVREGKNVWEIACEIASYIMAELDRSGELQDIWLRERLTELVISDQEAHYHVAGLELGIIADSIQHEWAELAQVISTQRRVSMPDWLRVAAAANEVETLRRALSNCVVKELLSVCVEFHDRVFELAHNSADVSVEVSPGVGLTSEQISLMVNNLEACAERLWGWQNSPLRDAQWPIDELVMATVLLLANMAIVLGKSGKNTGKVELGHGFDLSRCSEMIHSLIGLYSLQTQAKMDPEGSSRAIQGVMEAAINCGREARYPRLGRRRVGTLPHGAIPGLYSDGPTALDLGGALGQHGVQIFASKSSLLPFPQVISHRHSRGCAFSADTIERVGERPVLTALSLPPYAWRDPGGVVRPSIREQSGIKRTIIRIGPILRCLWGKHTIFLAPFVLVYTVEVILKYARLEKPWLSSLIPYIVSIVSRLFLIPFCISAWREYRRLRNRHRQKGEGRAGG